MGYFDSMKDSMRVLREGKRYSIKKKDPERTLLGLQGKNSKIYKKKLGTLIERTPIGGKRKGNWLSLYLWGIKRPRGKIGRRFTLSGKSWHGLYGMAYGQKKRTATEAASSVGGGGRNCVWKRGGHVERRHPGITVSKDSGLWKKFHLLPLTMEGGFVGFMAT